MESSNGSPYSKTSSVDSHNLSLYYHVMLPHTEVPRSFGNGFPRQEMFMQRHCKEEGKPIIPRLLCSQPEGR